MCLWLVLVFILMFPAPHNDLASVDVVLTAVLVDLSVELSCFTLQWFAPSPSFSITHVKQGRAEPAFFFFFAA